MSFTKILRAKSEISLNLSSGFEYDFVPDEIQKVEFGTFEEYLEIWGMGFFVESNEIEYDNQSISVIPSPNPPVLAPIPSDSLDNGDDIDIDDDVTPTKEEDSSPITIASNICPICGDGFGTPKGLRIHLGRSHK